MQVLSRFFRIVVFLLIFGIAFPGFALYSNVPAEQQSGEVKIVIRNSTFEYQGGVLKPDEASTIVIQNQDRIVHGFNSAFLEDLNVQVETEDVTTFGKGIKGVHINPGKTARLHFISPKPGKFSFRCDLHPAMKGELLLLSVGAV